MSEKKFNFKSPGVYVRETYSNYSITLEEYLKNIPIDQVINVLGIENVQNYLRNLKIKKINHEK